MKESERLTTATYKHMTDKYKTATKKWEVSFQKVYDQLFAYEETGLSPEEVERLKHECEDKERAYNEEYQSRRILKEKNAILVKRLDEQCDTCPAFERLKAENAELRAKVEGTPNLEFQIGDIAYYIGFAFCDGYDEQDEMTHDVKFYVCQKRLDTESERLHACGDYLEQKAFKSKKAAKEFAAARLKELETNE